MKRIGLIISVLIGLGIQLNSQILDESVLFSQSNYLTTARSAGMSGAFGALGADFSSLSSNPAGVAVYRKSEFNFTPELYVQNTDATYLPGSSNIPYNDNRFNLNINNLGFVWALKSGNDKGLVALNFGMGFNRLNTYHANYLIKGENQDFSFADHAIDGAVGVIPDNLNPYFEQLFYDGFVIDTFGNNTSYGPTTTLPVDQRREINYKGRLNEWTFSTGANISNKLYIGASINYQNLYYKYDLSHREDYTSSVDGLPAWFDFREGVDVYGYGFNLKAGFIYTPIKLIRIGGAVHTPTFLSMEEYYNTSIDGTYLSGRIYPVDQNGYDLGDAYSDYSLQTPMKLMGSIAFVIGKYGLISADYEYVDYTKMKYRRVYDKAYADQLENEIASDLTGAHNIRVGGELRLGYLSLRAGYAYYGTPYAKGTWYENAYNQQVSGGIGLNAGPARIDFAYVKTFMLTYYNMYSVNATSGVYNALSELNISDNMFKMTATLRF